MEDTAESYGSKFASTVLLYAKCCYDPNCIHPVCSGAGSTSSDLHWFGGGPTVSYVPLPIPDPNQPWGSTKCKEVCYGHFLTPDKVESSTSPPIDPPSSIIKRH